MTLDIKGNSNIYLNSFLFLVNVIYEQPPKVEKTKYIEPDSIKAPKIFYDATNERPPSAKVIWSRGSSATTDFEFDYGTAIGFQPEDWPYQW